MIEAHWKKRNLIGLAAVLDIMRRITRLGPTSGSFASWLSVISEAIHIVFCVGFIDEDRNSIWLCITSALL